jgi:outer membrane biosynthesis protein TonB
MGFLDKLFGRKNVSNPVKPADEPKNTSTIVKNDQVKQTSSASPAPTPKAEMQKPVPPKTVEPEKPQPVKQEIVEKPKEKEAVSPKPAVKSEAHVPPEHDTEGAKQETKKQMDEMLLRMYGNDSSGLKKSQESIRYNINKQETNK